MRSAALGLLMLSLCHANGVRNETQQHAAWGESRQRFRRRGIGRQQARIVGGKDVTGEKFSHFVELPNGCGGTLIHNDLVLTAAHCVDGYQNAALLRSEPSVFIGGTKTQGGVKRRVVDARIDPRYNRSTKSYDFALLLLDTPITGIQPIPLIPEPTFPSDGAPLAVVGYGRTQRSVQGKSPTLQQAMVNARSDCSSNYPTGRVKNYEMICANAPDYSQDACQGEPNSAYVWYLLFVCFFSWLLKHPNSMLSSIQATVVAH